LAETSHFVVVDDVLKRLAARFPNSTVTLRLQHHRVVQVQVDPMEDTYAETMPVLRAIFDHWRLQEVKFGDVKITTQDGDITDIKVIGSFRLVDDDKKAVGEVLRATCN
jgi:hypothetical protein